MKFVVFVHGNAASEGGQMPSEAELAEMTEFNEQLVEAGVMVDGEGLHPTSQAARVEYTNGDAEVIDGPFGEEGAIVAGYWILQGSSIDEIKDWMRKAPFREGSIEIRQIFEAEDFGEEFTPELQAREAEMRRRVAEQAAS